MHGKQPSGLLTQKKMLHSAISLFLEKGYEKATTAEIARGAGMTPSAFFRAYPSKEALLLELVKQMFDNQFAEAERRTGEMDQLMMYAVETALQMHLAELSESMRDLYVTAYSLPSTAAYIYRNTAKRLQTIFSPYLPSLQEKDFYELDIASGSITRGFMAMPCDLYFTMEQKLRRYLDCCFKLYDVPKEQREAVIEQVARMDLRLCRQRVLGADHDHARVCTRDAAGELGIEHDAEAGEHGHVQPSLSQRGEETPVAAELKRERRLRIQPVILADLRNDRPQLICPGITDAQIRRCAERGLSALRRGVVIADDQLPALPVKHLTRRRQTHAALAAHEQRIAKLLLQQLDLLADCRL